MGRSCKFSLKPIHWLYGILRNSTMINSNVDQRQILLGGQSLELAETDKENHSRRWISTQHPGWSSADILLQSLQCIWRSTAQLNPVESCWISWTHLPVLLSICCCALAFQFLCLTQLAQDAMWNQCEITRKIDNIWAHMSTCSNPEYSSQTASWLVYKTNYRWSELHRAVGSSTSFIVQETAAL